MGMDVIGQNPTGKKGECFSSNVWWWHPLASYCEEVAPEITKRCEHWHSNDGDGLNRINALALADALDAEIKSRRTAAYTKKYNEAQRNAPDVKCDLCEGAGVRKPIPQPGDGELIEAEADLKCDGCDGTGKERPFWTHYSFNTKIVREFIAFLRECGGFEIW